MRKIISLLILTTMIVFLAAAALTTSKTAVATTPTVRWMCSIPSQNNDGQGWDTENTCSGKCKDPSGEIEGSCIQSVILTPKGIQDLINKYTRWFMALAGTFATIMIIIGGIMFMTARGDDTKVKNARKMILYALLGLAIVLLAGGAIWTIQRFLTTA